MTEVHATEQPDLEAGVPLFWKIFLWVAALYNFAVGLAGMFAPGVNADGLILSLMIAAFGLVYALVASDPLRHAPILWAGVAAKLGVVMLLGPANWGGSGNTAMGVAVAGDLVFGLGFLAFLLTVGRRDR